MPHRRNQSDGANESRRKFLKASGAGAVALSLAGCSGGGSPETETKTSTADQTTTKEATPTENTSKAEDIKEGGTLVYGMSSKPDSSNYLVASTVYSGVALNQIYESGTTLDPVTSEVRPWVFTDWTVENTSGKNPKPDVYFNMREGLKWNDGEDFTKEDVLFTYNYLIENNPGQYASAIGPMKSIEESSKSDWDFHLKLKKPVSVWDSEQLQLPLLPKHKWEGKDYKKYDPMKANPDNGPVGLGPARLTKFDPSTSMQLTLDNEHYYETLSQLEWRKNHDQLIAGGPFLDKVNFKIYGSETAMTQAFLQGEIDTHYGTMKTSKHKQVKDKEGMGLIPAKSSGFSYYGFNLRNKPLDDATFRQAMSFLYDDYFWVTRLMQNKVWKGDFAQSNGYPVPRPDYQFAGKDQMMTHPATNAFDFRSKKAAVPNVKGVRKFLKEGKVIDGSKGKYVGKDYPGSLSGVSASQSKSKYDYTFGKVKSSVLKNHQSADKEIRVNGKTIPEIMGGKPITLFMDPPKKGPKEAKAIERWVDNLKSVGIPIKTKAMSFNTMVSKVYVTEEFDVYPMGWGGTGPFGSSVYAFFHSSKADDLTKKEGDDEKKNSSRMVYNSTGYGLGKNGADDLLESARTAMDADKRNKATAKALEKIYLDMPYMLRDYAKMRWPLNTAKLGGSIPNIVDPPYANFGAELNNLHLKE